MTVLLIGGNNLFDGKVPATIPAEKVATELSELANF